MSSESDRLRRRERRLQRRRARQRAHAAGEPRAAAGDAVRDQRKVVTIVDPDLGRVRLRGLSQSELRSIMRELAHIDPALLGGAGVEFNLDAGRELPTEENVRAALFQAKVVRAGVVAPVPRRLEVPAEIADRMPGVREFIQPGEGWTPDAVARLSTAVVERSWKWQGEAA